ncbi:GNAT family N-acetyltransferase [Methanofollis fontis]|uniref:GNAT family N-acetyltransferase n=1 Tax=Methanofollis fontis TaxID=2052832 RepID=A0A483CW72_9EURY|nr:GNAT family N-acetyltransferase [Methanofollis fontis]TAJ45420.1 GNAT family N-acetyltransferase [Methanofollis fontis]
MTLFPSSSPVNPPGATDAVGTPVIRRSRPDDFEGVYSLYLDVAAIPGGIARSQDEITPDYVVSFLGRSGAAGLSMVALDGDRIVGEVHAARPVLRAFSHMLTDLTICVRPAYQGRGWGRRLFSEFLRVVREDMPDVRRVELFTRQSNRRAIAFYTSLGFCMEGILRGRIAGVDGDLEDDILMGWVRPPPGDDDDRY